MKTLILLLSVLAISLTSYAQVIDSVTGKFYACADDNAIVFLNGTQILNASLRQNKKVTESGPAVLKVGDHLIFQLSNKGGPKGLLAQFVSTDGKTIIHFPRSAYRRLDNPTATSFTDTEFRGYRSATFIKHRLGNKLLPFNSDSDWVWGQNETCALALIVTRNLIKPIKP